MLTTCQAQLHTCSTVGDEINTDLQSSSGEKDEIYKSIQLFLSKYLGKLRQLL